MITRNLSSLLFCLVYSYKQKKRGLRTGEKRETRETLWVGQRGKKGVFVFARPLERKNNQR